MKVPDRCVEDLRAAGPPGVRRLPRGRRVGGGAGSVVAALPAARGVLRRPGCACVAGRRPVGRHRRRTVAIVEPEPAGLPSRPARPGGALPRFGRPAALRGGAVGQVRGGRRLRPAPPPRFRQPQPRRAQALPAGHADVDLDPPVGRGRGGRPDQGRAVVGRGARPVLAGPRASRHHEPPPRRDVRRGGGLDDRSRRNPVRVPDRRAAPWVAHDRRTIGPLRAPRRLRRVGTALDRPSRLGRARDAVRTGSRSSSGRRPGSGRCSASPLRATRTGTSRPWPTRRRATPGPI